MNLQIRDKRAHELARRLADMRQTNMTEAVVSALEYAIEREKPKENIVERFAELAAELRRRSPGGGRDMTKDEIDAMWGHE
jgi:antitoxin VapB